MKLSITDIEITANPESLNAVLELIKACANAETPTQDAKAPKPKAAKPAKAEKPAETEYEEAAEDEVEETPKPSKAKATKTKAAKAKAAKPPKADDDELSEEEQDALDDMSEEEMRGEIKRLVPEYKAKIGLAKLKKLIKEAGGFDGKNVKPSLIPEENLADTIKQMAADLDEV
jgi:hypothetical protein